MQPRNLTEREFKMATVAEYLSFGLTLPQARAAADEEWKIRQEVEAMRLKSVKLKTYSAVKGFGHTPINLETPGSKSRRSKVEHGELHQVKFKLSAEARERLKSKAVLSVDDVNDLLCGDQRFLVEYARLVGFPAYEPKLRGYRCWKVYDFLRPYKRVLKIDLRSK